MIRIFYVIDHLDLGGVEHRLLRLITGLDPQHFLIAVCPLYSGRALENDYRAHTTVFDIHRHGKYDLTCVGRLARVMARFRPHLVHTWQAESNVLGVCAARVARVPVIITSVTSVRPPAERPPRRRRLLRHLRRALAPWTDLTVSNTMAGCRHMAESGRQSRTGCRVVYNGVPRTLCQAPPAAQLAQLREAIGLHPGVPVIGTVGRLVEEKDHRSLLHALRLLRDADIATQTVIVGDGILRDDLATLAHALQLDDTIFFTGARHDVPHLLHLFDLFVLPSHQEGLSNTLLEAMAAGRPTVASALEGTREVITHGVHGLLVPPRDPSRLAAGLRHLLHDGDYARLLATNGQTLVHERFTVERMAQEMAQHYRAQLALKGIAVERS